MSRSPKACSGAGKTIDDILVNVFQARRFETVRHVGYFPDMRGDVFGGHLVGMSTSLEAIAARHAGLEVLGVSLVTNAAAGISPEPLSHAEVLAAGAAAGPRISALLAQVIRRI